MHQPPPTQSTLGASSSTLLAMPAMEAACAHLHRTMTGTLEPGEEPAATTRVYEWLPSHIAKPGGIPIPPQPIRTAHNGDTLHIPMSEGLAQALMIARCGSVEEGTKQLKELYSRINVLGGIPDPQDTTLQKVELPGVGCHMRFWLGHQTRTISFDLCDDRTGQLVAKPPSLEIFHVNAITGDLTELKSLQWCQGFKPRTTMKEATFVVAEGTELEFVFKGTTLKTTLLPTRGQPVRPAVDPTVLQELPVRVTREERHARMLALTGGRAF